MTEPGHDLDSVGALDLGRGVTAHHLDRLEDEGLLESEHRRLNDRRGPGAGRPAKVYRRTAAEISVNLPARDEASGIGATVAPRLGARSSTRTRRACFLDELGGLGFEPERRDDGVVVLHNCPFHRLASAHTKLVWGLNLSFLDGLLREVDGTGLHAAREPEDGYCCVRFLATPQ
jgi:predicted ArsR family transcriptional regulator